MKISLRRTINERIVLSSISLYFNPGSFVTIISSNGVGKSTSPNIVSGRYQVDVRHMKTEDEDVMKLLNYKIVRYVSRASQDPMAGTAPHLSIEENLALV